MYSVCRLRPLEFRRGENGTLKITYYKGGTGSEWLEELAAEFEEATKIKVELTADAKATENAKTLLESNRDLPDLMFILYTNWHEYVQKGWLADMDDLFDGTFSYDVNDIKITSKYDVGNTSVYAESGAKTGLTLKDIMTSVSWITVKWRPNAEMTNIITSCLGRLRARVSCTTSIFWKA